MATYYSSSAVEKHGRRLSTLGTAAESNEVKIAILDNGAWRIATDSMTDARAMKDSAMWLSCDVFAVPQGKLELCADVGQEPSTYQARREAAEAARIAFEASQPRPSAEDLARQEAELEARTWGDVPAYARTTVGVFGDLGVKLRTGEAVALKALRFDTAQLDALLAEGPKGHEAALELLQFARGERKGLSGSVQDTLTGKGIMPLRLEGGGMICSSFQSLLISSLAVRDGKLERQIPYPDGANAISPPVNKGEFGGVWIPGSPAAGWQSAVRGVVSKLTFGYFGHRPPKVRAGANSTAHHRKG